MSTHNIVPMDTTQLDTSTVKALYDDEQLTSEEYVILDFLSAVHNMKKNVRSASVTVSFQGLKRKVDIHQARLTKALNRLQEKDLVTKNPDGYSLTEKGLRLSEKLMDRFGKTTHFNPTIHTHRIKGKIQAAKLSNEDLHDLSKAFVGIWFGDFRFVAKTDYEDFIELEWLSTNGLITAKLVLGPDNQISLSTSSAKYSQSEMELQIMYDRVASILEKKFDLLIHVDARDIFENAKILTQPDIASKFAA